MSAQIKVDDLFFVRDRTLPGGQPPAAGHSLAGPVNSLSGGQVINGRTFKNLFTFSHTVIYWGVHFKLVSRQLTSTLLLMMGP